MCLWERGPVAYRPRCWPTFSRVHLVALGQAKQSWRVRNLVQLNNSNCGPVWVESGESAMVACPGWGKAVVDGVAPLEACPLRPTGQVPVVVRNGGQTPRVAAQGLSLL